MNFVIKSPDDKDGLHRGIIDQATSAFFLRDEARAESTRGQKCLKRGRDAEGNAIGFNDNIIVAIE